MLRTLLVSALALACPACTTMALAPPKAATDPAPQMPALEARIFELVQEERHRIDPKAGSLAMDSELVGIARQRSTDMAAKNYLEHKNPDGQSAVTIIMDEDASFQGLLGEDIAAQTYARADFDVEKFAKRFVDAWVASPKHKENLAYERYERSGVGAAVNGNTVYVTQLFASDMGLPPVAPDPRSAAK